MPLTAAELKTQQYQWNIAHPRIVESWYQPPLKDATPPQRTGSHRLDAAAMNATHLELVAAALRRSTTYHDQVTAVHDPRIETGFSVNAAATLDPALRPRPSLGGEFDLESLLKHVERTQPTSYEELNTWFAALSVPALHRIAITTQAEACGMLSRGKRYEGPVDLRGQPLRPDPDAERKRLEHEAEVARLWQTANRQHAMIDVQQGSRVAAPISEHQPLPSELGRQAISGPDGDTRKARPGRTISASAKPSGTRVGDMTSADASGAPAYDATSIEVAAPSAPYALTTMHRSLAKLEAAMRRPGRGYGC